MPKNHPMEHPEDIPQGPCWSEPHRYGGSGPRVSDQQPNREVSGLQGRIQVPETGP